MNTSNTIKKAKIGQILDVTNNYIFFLLNQFILDIIASQNLTDLAFLYRIWCYRYYFYKIYNTTYTEKKYSKFK